MLKIRYRRNYLEHNFLLLNLVGLVRPEIFVRYMYIFYLNYKIKTYYYLIFYLKNENIFVLNVASKQIYTCVKNKTKIIWL